MKHASKILSDIVDGFSSLPGVGKKTALRLAMHLADKDKDKVIQFAQNLVRLAEDLKTCKSCFSYSDYELCEICSNLSRNEKIICVVESIKDLIAIEDTGQFHGKYLVLGGLISPIDGVGPDKLNIQALITRCRNEKIEEIIMALRPSIDGDTTIYYISKHLPIQNIKITLLARGVSFGSELEYADELTLGRSIVTRTLYSLAEN